MTRVDEKRLVRDLRHRPDLLCLRSQVPPDHRLRGRHAPDLVLAADVFVSIGAFGTIDFAFQANRGCNQTHQSLISFDELRALLLDSLISDFLFMDQVFYIPVFPIFHFYMGPCLLPIFRWCKRLYGAIHSTSSTCFLFALRREKRQFKKICKHENI